MGFWVKSLRLRVEGLRGFPDLSFSFTCLVMSLPSFTLITSNQLGLTQEKFLSFAEYESVPSSAGHSVAIQGYLLYKKTRPPRTLQYAYA